MRKTINFLLLCIAMVLSFSSCSKDDNDLKPNLDKTEVTLYVEETASLTYSGGDCTWTSDNPLIASVEDGIITANHVGETFIHANDVNCKVTVKPHYTRYYEPYIAWGEGKEKVKQYMKNYEIEDDNNDRLAYRGEAPVLLYAYTFTNNKLKSSTFAIDILESSYLVDYLIERYIPISNEEPVFVFMTPDKKTVVGLQIESSYALITYIPSNADAKSSAINIQNIFSDINQAVGNNIKK